MAQSGVSVSPDCISVFNDLKLGKQLKWVIYKISDDLKEIVVEETSKDPNYDIFREKLLSAKTKAGPGGEKPDARYAVFDFEYDAGTEGKRNKLAFITWAPGEAGIKTRMLYSTSKEAIKRALNGIAVDVQANDEDSIEYQDVLERVFNLSKSNKAY